MDQIHKSFAREAVTWRQLSHPNLLPFYGVYLIGEKRAEKLCLVCPWMQNGNLSHYLDVTTVPVNCVLLVLDVAQGLEYLHSQKIVHADLKGVNILVSDVGRACLADFGLAVAKDSSPVNITMMTTGGTGGSLNWSAPELLPDMDDFTTNGSEGAKPEAPCDIYAFAMVCYEIFSGFIPFQGKAEHHVIIAIGQGRRPERPIDTRSKIRGLTDQIWDIIVTCWNSNPERRLTAGQVVQLLRALPNFPVENRPADNHRMPPSSSAAYAHAQHPFEALGMVLEQGSSGYSFHPGPISQMYGQPEMGGRQASM